MPQSQLSNIPLDGCACSTISTFNFDGIKGEDSTQDEMFSMIGRGVVENCLKGYNGTIFA